jgi:hypothetical protein
VVAAAERALCNSNTTVHSEARRANSAGWMLYQGKYACTGLPQTKGALGCLHKQCTGYDMSPKGDGVYIVVCRSKCVLNVCCAGRISPRMAVHLVGDAHGMRQLAVTGVVERAPSGTSLAFAVVSKAQQVPPDCSVTAVKDCGDSLCYHCWLTCMSKLLAPTRLAVAVASSRRLCEGDRRS